MRFVYLVLGALLMLCGAAPLFYSVRNLGVLALLLLGGAMILLGLFWKKTPKILRRVFTGILALGAGVFLTVSGLMVAQILYTPPQGEALPMVVLGAKVYESGPGPILRQRLDVAGQYLQENPEAMCIVTGGQGPDEPASEASVMATYLEENWQIARDRIFLEDQSTSTQENLHFAKELLGQETRIVLATSEFHQLRGAMMARQEGLLAYSASAKTGVALLPAYWVRDAMAVVVSFFS